MIRQMLMWTVSAAVAVGLLAGCAGGSGVSVPEFPGRQEVAQMESVEAPDEYFDGKRVSVDRWEMKGPLPDQLGHAPSTGETYLSERLHALVAEVNPVETMISKQMNCIARQLGLFRLEHGALPDPILESYLTSRCGVPDTIVGMTRWDMNDVADLDDRELVDALWSNEKHGQKVLRDAVQGKNRVVGAALVRRGSKALILVTHDTKQVDIEPRPLIQPEGDTIHLRGRLLSPEHNPYGRVTIGPFDAGDCEPVDDAEPPRFHLRCPRSPQDSNTKVVVGQTHPENFFGDSVLGARIWRDTDEADTFRISPIGAIVASADKRLSASNGPSTSFEIDSDQAMRRFMALVNEVRDEAGLEPMELHSAQSREVRRLAGHLLVAPSSNQPGGKTRDGVRDRVIRGLAAGWEVEAPISGAEFAVYSLSRPTVAAMLARGLDAPGGRNALLTEKRDLLAAALVPDKSRDGIGFAGFAYTGVPEAKFSQRRSHIVDQINAERQARGIPEFDVDGATFVDCRRIAQRLEAGSLGVGQAQNRLIEAAVDEWGANVSSNLMVTQSLEDITVPSRLLDVGISKAALVVAPFQPEGAAWTSYAIMWVIPSGQTA